MKTQIKTVLLVLSIALLAGCAKESSQEYDARFSEQNEKLQLAIEAAERAQRSAEEALAEAQYLREVTYQYDERAQRMLERSSKK